MSDRIHLSKAHVTEVEEQLVLEAMRSGWIAPLGPFVDRFEREVAERVGVAGALALSSGTAALHLALLHAGAAPGRVVVLPAMTFAATANAVLYTGATPVFVDSREDDGNVDIPLMIEAIRTLQSEGTDVAAAMSVDLFGRTCDYATLEPALAELGVPLIEDAAEAFGAHHGGKAAGSFGQSAALSFNGNKIMTTSGGGMLLSDDLNLIGRARYLSTQARQPKAWYEHNEMGFNYRMSNILAALGLGQLQRLEDMIAIRRAHRSHYEDALSGVPGIRFLGNAGGLGPSEDNCWLTCIVIEEPTSIDALITALDESNIEARHLWKPMHSQPLFANSRVFETGVATQLFANGLALPSGSNLTASEIDRCADVLRSLLDEVA